MLASRLCDECREEIREEVDALGSKPAVLAAWARVDEKRYLLEKELSRMFLDSVRSLLRQNMREAARSVMEACPVSSVTRALCADAIRQYKLDG